MIPDSTTPFRFIAAPFTPKAADGSVDYDRVPAMAAFLQLQGIAGVFVNGTTGEGLSLTVEERRRLAVVWQKATRAKLRLIVHVGHSCLEDARELARHAESLEVEAIAAQGPCFFSCNDPITLTGYCGRIAEGAPGTPFYYYHIPSMTRVGCRASEALPHLARRIPTFAGVKFTHDDLDDYRKCLTLTQGRHEIFFGRDELLLAALKQGAVSAVGSTYNFATPLYRRLVQAFASGDEAEAELLQGLASQGIDIMVRTGGMAAIQAGMALAGFDPGALRLPLKAFTTSEREKLRHALAPLNYLENIQTRDDALTAV